MYNTASKDVVLEASSEHYDSLVRLLESLLVSESEIDLLLNIKFRGVSAELNLNESLLVINTLAVKRAALRGGLWSEAGKNVEKLLVITLCKLFGVADEHFSAKPVGKVSRKVKKGSTEEANFTREIDFYLMSGGQAKKCEIKLMGAGNSESADAIFARDTDIFIADKLSDQNKEQLNSNKILWVELRGINGIKKFAEVLTALQIPHVPFDGDLESKLNEILDINI